MAAVKKKTTPNHGRAVRIVGVPDGLQKRLTAYAARSRVPVSETGIVLTAIAEFLQCTAPREAAFRPAERENTDQLYFWLTPDMSDRLEAFRNRCRAKPSRKAVVLTAVEEFLDRNPSLERE